MSNDLKKLEIELKDMREHLLQRDPYPETLDALMRVLILDIREVKEELRALSEQIREKK